MKDKIFLQSRITVPQQIILRMMTGGSYIRFDAEYKTYDFVDMEGNASSVKEPTVLNLILNNLIQKRIKPGDEEFFITDKGRKYIETIKPETLLSHISRKTGFVNNLDTEGLLKLLPKKTYNKESYGLCLQIDGDGKHWTVCYYSRFVKDRDKSFPYFREKTVQKVLARLYKYIITKRPNLLKAVK